MKRVELNEDKNIDTHIFAKYFVMKIDKSIIVVAVMIYTVVMTNIVRSRTRVEIGAG